MKSNIPSTLYFLPCVLIVLLFLSFFFSASQALAQLNDPLQGMDPITLAGKVINYVLGLLGAGVFVVFLIGGGRILFSAGNPKMVEGGKKTLVYAVVGLAVIFLSYAVLNFFFTILQKGAG